jgi:DNA-binding helix-turn-helix protein
VNVLTIGERIKQCRTNLGLSVDELAKLIGKNRATIYRYESSEILDLPTSILVPLAKALHTTPAYLMGWVNKTTASNNQQQKLTNHEEKVIIAYRDKPEMQPAVDKLLGVEEIHTTPSVRAARSFGDKSKIDRNADIDEQRFIDAPESDIDI